MQTTPTTTAVTITGPVHAVHTHADGAVTLTPAAGGALTLTTDQAADRPAAGCGCTTAPATPVAEHPDLLQARAIAAHLAQFDVEPARRSTAVDETYQVAAVRVASPHGLYALLIPPPGRPFPVLHNGRRIHTLSARRVPGATDESVGTQFAMIMRDRGDL